MDDMKLKARGASLKGLMDAMGEDDAMAIPAVTLKISAGPGGIKIEKDGIEVGADGEEKEQEGPGPDESMGHEMAEGEEMGGEEDPFEAILKKKKRGMMGM